MLNMFRMLIDPSSGTCDLCAELLHGLYWPVRIAVFALARLLNKRANAKTSILTDQYNPCNNSAHKSQAPEDGCINVRNMLSIK